MSEQSTWKVDVKSLSHRQIIESLEQLKGSGHHEVIIALRKELIGRARAKGLRDEKIIKQLCKGVPRGLRLRELATVWAPMLGLSVKDFKRIASEP